MQLVAHLEGGKVEVKLGAFVNVEDILHPVFRQRVEQQGTALFLFRVGGDFDERAVVDDEVLRDQVVDRDGVHRARLVRLPAVIDLEERAVAQLGAVKAVIGVLRKGHLQLPRQVGAGGAAHQQDGLSRVVHREVLDGAEEAGGVRHGEALLPGHGGGFRFIFLRLRGLLRGFGSGRRRLARLGGRFWRAAGREGDGGGEGE